VKFDGFSAFIGYVLGRAQGGFHLFGSGYQPTAFPAYPPHHGMPSHPEPVIVPHPQPVMTSTAVNFGEQPAGVPAFPGPAWSPYTPVPGSVAARAGLLLHTMHLGETKYESGPYGGPVAYHMQPLHPDGSGKMVTAWKLKALPGRVAT